MEHASHCTMQAPTGRTAARAGLNRVALSATVHCLTGCAIGEVLGMVIGTWLGWGTGTTIGLAVTLAFASLMLAIPGAMSAGLASPLFWGSLAVSLVVAGAAAYPVNRWLIARGRGHALAHPHHH
jgi:hypothetical protein